MIKRKIELTEESYSRIVEELLNAKNAIEYGANDEGGDLEDPEHESHEEWTELCKALEELGA
jgi:hypothetical protein